MSKKRRRDRKREVLADHERRGKVFVPPFLAKVGPLNPVRWIDDLLPELLGVAVLIDDLGLRRAVEVLKGMADAVNAVVVPEKARSFAVVSDYTEVRPEHAVQIQARLREAGTLDAIGTALVPLVSLYTECPLRSLLPPAWWDNHGIALEDALSKLRRIVRDMSDRRGKQATLAQTTALYVMMATGKIRIRKDMLLADPNAVLDYPNTDRSRQVASAVRAALNAFGGVNRGAWPDYFWRHGYDTSVCEFPARGAVPSEDTESVIDPEALVKATEGFKEALFSQIRDRWTHSRLDLAHPTRGEVLGGLIARQARMATAIACDPELWAIDLGRILLRCMVDTHIVLAWLSTKGTAKDFEEFVNYGLGQEKLLLEHLTAQLDERNPEVGERRKELDAMRGWIENQLLMDFLPVNIASWTKKTPRQMADEAGCLDTYNLSYTPFSAVLHGSWNALAQLNLQFCVNPLHRLHRVPRLEAPPIYLGTVGQVARIMGESFRLWEATLGIDPLSDTASQHLLRALPIIA